MNIDGTRGQVLASELADTAKAMEAYHDDLKTDIFLSLTTPSGANGFQALYDNSVVADGNGDNTNLRARWNGPYIKFTTNNNPRYGEMYLTKAASDHTQSCTPEDICYLYLVYSNVKSGIATEANKTLDGEAEKKPDSEGRLQWSPGAENDTVALFFRAHRALSQNMDY